MMSGHVVHDFPAILKIEAPYCTSFYEAIDRKQESLLLISQACHLNENRTRKLKSFMVLIFYHNWLYDCWSLIIVLILRIYMYFAGEYVD